MPLEPPWPIEVLDYLHAALERLRKQAAVDPRDPTIPVITADVEAIIAKLEPMAKGVALV